MKRPKRDFNEGYGEMERRRLRKILLAKLNSRTYKSPCGCWLFETGTANYGTVTHEGQVYSAHRLAYMLYQEQNIPAGCMICHHCDVPACVNPKHLYLGNAKTNRADYLNRGRLRIEFAEIANEYFL